MNEALIRTKENLEKKGYTVTLFETPEEAAAYLKETVSGKTVGFGGSVTLQQMGLYPMLSERNRVLWHWALPEGMTAEEVRREAMTAQVYFSSVNGLAETGEIVNIDGTCNRIASILYGHEKVYLVAGSNKLAPDLDGAIHRARNVAAPKNALRLGCKTPCAVRGDRCYDCDAPGRICRGLSVLWTKPGGCACEVVLIDAPLGY